jgi:hypothetical protein
MKHSSSEHLINRTNHDDIKDLSYLFKESRGLDI